MTQRITSALTVSLILAPAVNAQIFDNFDGDALAPHWTIWPTPAHLQHHVSGGMLHVTDLPLPSIPHTPQNDATILASFAPVSGDFVARAVVGWDKGSQRGLSWAVTASTTSLIGSFTYSESFPGGPALRVDGGVGQFAMFNAPLPGMHEFAVSRQGSTLAFYLDGSLLVSFPSLSHDPVGRVGMDFWIAYPNDGYQPMYVDVVEIIPAPAGSAALAMLLAICSRRRRP